MKRTLTAFAALALTATVASAQDMAAAVRPVTFGISAGVAIPTGDFADEQIGAAKTGYQVAGHVGFVPAMLPVGLRFDGTWGQHKIEGVDVDNANYKMWSIAGNAVLQVPGMIMAKPYLVGGLGYYNLQVDVDEVADEEVDDDDGGLGFQIGIGTKFQLAGFATFAEVKWTTFQVGDDNDKTRVNVIPITFGIMF